MPMETVGSGETLLRLFASYQGLNSVQPDPLEVWRRIAAYARQGGTYRFYPVLAYDPENPPSEFAADVAQLVAEGLLRPLADGRVEVTPLGRCFAFGLAVPPSLESLAQEIERVGPERLDTVPTGRT
jgi:hypothetical protein